LISRRRCRLGVRGVVPPHGVQGHEYLVAGGRGVVVDQPSAGTHKVSVVHAVAVIEAVQGIERVVVCLPCAAPALVRTATRGMRLQGGFVQQVMAKHVTTAKGAIIRCPAIERVVLEIHELRSPEIGVRRPRAMPSTRRISVVCAVVDMSGVSDTGRRLIEQGMVNYAEAVRSLHPGS